MGHSCVWLGLALWVLAPGRPGADPRAADETGPARLTQPALRVLHRALQQDRPVYSSAVVLELARYTHGDPDSARACLGRLLEAAQAGWEADAESWDRLLQLGGGRMGRRRTERLVRGLVEAGRRMVWGSDDYLLSASLAHAARRARVPAVEARDYLVRALESGQRGPAPEAGEHRPGIAVTGRTEPYVLSSDPLRLFFGSADEVWLREQVREIHRFLVPRTARSLSAKPPIAWALDKRQVTALLEPDVVLALQVQQLSFTGTNVDLRPCIEVAMELVEQRSDGLPEEETVRHCTEAHGSSHTRTLEAFYDEVAELLGQAALRHLERRDQGAGAAGESSPEATGD